MPPSLNPESEPKLLLVEGRDEELVLGALLRHLGIHDVQVQNYGGKNRLGYFLVSLTGEPNFDQIQSLGIVRDADDNAHSALESVQSGLRNVGLPIPQTFLSPAGNGPTVSVFIMPDNDGPGALERLCLNAWAEDPAMPCVDAFMQCVQDNADKPPVAADKARLHAFLASREDPDLRLGLAAQRGYLPWHRPAFAALSTFLRNL